MFYRYETQTILLLCNDDSSGIKNEKHSTFLLINTVTLKHQLVTYLTEDEY
jgi:hypothetical protein